MKDNINQKVANNKLLQPDEILKALNKNFPMETYDAYFTGIYGVLNIETLKFSFANAGHPAPIVIKKDKSVEFLNNADIPIGILLENEFESYTHSFSAGDSVIFYTDGIYEISVKEGLSMSKEVLANIFIEEDGDLNTKFEYTVDKILRMSINAEFEDDVSLIGFEIK
jgi:sigma-B regulation protein RsbU (phosphoserine phosphatase)